MTSERPAYDDHLEPDAIQVLIDGKDPPGETLSRVAEKHLEGCARCRSRVEAWQEMFGELDGLRRFRPPGRLAERVISAIDRPETSPAASRAWWRFWRYRRRGARGHVSPGRLQELADGVLSGVEAAWVRTHLAACRRCETRLAGWRRLISSLETLPALSPSPGFAEAVMLGWRRNAAGAVPRPARRRVLWPRTARGWTLAGGLAGAPALALMGVASFALTVPGLTAGTLLPYARWQMADAASALGRSVLHGWVQSTAVFQAHAFADYLIDAPAAAATGGALFTTLTLAAAWVLHRNLGLGQTHAPA